MIDKKKETFACAATGSKSLSKVKNIPENDEEEKKGVEVVDQKIEIVAELTKLLNIYKAMGPQEKGKVMGYQRAISNIKVYSKPITNA